MQPFTVVFRKTWVPAIARTGDHLKSSEIVRKNLQTESWCLAASSHPRRTSSSRGYGSRWRARRTRSKSSATRRRRRWTTRSSSRSTPIAPSTLKAACIASMIATRARRPHPPLRSKTTNIKPRQPLQRPIRQKPNKTSASQSHRNSNALILRWTPLLPRTNRGSHSSSLLSQTKSAQASHRYPQKRAHERVGVTFGGVDLPYRYRKGRQSAADISSIQYIYCKTRSGED